jgi:hypothetical protein
MVIQPKIFTERRSTSPITGESVLLGWVDGGRLTEFFVAGNPPMQDLLHLYLRDIVQKSRPLDDRPVVICADGGRMYSQWATAMPWGDVRLHGLSSVAFGEEMAWESLPPSLSTNTAAVEVWATIEAIRGNYPYLAYGLNGLLVRFAELKAEHLFFSELRVGKAFRLVGDSDQKTCWKINNALALVSFGDGHYEVWSVDRYNTVITDQHRDPHDIWGLFVALYGHAVSRYGGDVLHEIGTAGLPYYDCSREMGANETELASIRQTFIVLGGTGHLMSGLIERLASFIEKNGEEE